MELGAQVVAVAQQFFPQDLALLRGYDSQSGEGGVSLDWVDCVGEHVGGGEVLHVLRHIERLSADETVVDACSLAASADQQNVGAILEALFFPDSLAILADDSVIMPHSDRHKGLIFLSDPLNVDKVRGCRIQREDGLRDNHNAIFCILGPDSLEQLLNVLLIEMPTLVHVFGGRIRSLEKRILSELINDNVIVVLNQ